MIDNDVHNDWVSVESQQEQIPWPGIVGVMAALSIFALTFGLTYPLIALVLERQGVSELMIGLNAAMTPLGIILSAPIIPPVSQRVGAWRLAIVCILITMISFAFLGAFRTLVSWFVLRFVLGITINGLFIVSETWINQMVTTRTRGRVMGLYATILSLGFAVGPFIIPLTGTDGWTPFLVGEVAAIIALVVLIGVRQAVPTFYEEARFSIASFLPLAPRLLLAIGVVAVFFHALLSFLPLYGLRYGLNESTVAYALGVLIVGNVLLQYPVGWLADRVSKPVLMLSCTLLTVLGSLGLPLAITQPYLLWPLLFIWGGAAFGVYTVALIELGDRFSGTILLAGNAAFALMWGVGGMAGTPLTGSAIELLGPNGLPLVIGITFGIFAFFIIKRSIPMPKFV